MASSDDYPPSGQPQTDRYSDPSTPRHQPPASYDGGPPATTGDESLDTNEIIAIIAALVPGLGQMLMGQTVKGLVLLGVSLLTACFGGIISLASVVDAYLVAKAKQRRPVGDWEFFPDWRETLNV